MLKVLDTQYGTSLLQDFELACEACLPDGVGWRGTWATCPVRAVGLGLLPRDCDETDGGIPFNDFFDGWAEEEEALAAGMGRIPHPVDIPDDEHTAEVEHIRRLKVLGTGLAEILDKLALPGAHIDTAVMIDMLSKMATRWGDVTDGLFTEDPAVFDESTCMMQMIMRVFLDCWTMVAPDPNGRGWKCKWTRSSVQVDRKDLDTILDQSPSAPWRSTWLKRFGGNGLMEYPLRVLSDRAWVPLTTIRDHTADSGLPLTLFSALVATPHVRYSHRNQKGKGKRQGKGQGKGKHSSGGGKGKPLPEVHEPTAMTSRDCAACGRTAPHLKRCARCKSAWFCDRECQKVAWTGHKKPCRPAKVAGRGAAAT